MSLNQTLSDLFSHFADLYEMRGEPNDTFRVNTYRQVSRRLGNMSEQVEDLVKSGDINNIKGWGYATVTKITEFIETGKIETFEELKKSFPKGLLALLDIPSLGPKKVAKLWHQLGVTNITLLKEAIKNGHLDDLEGFGPKSIDNITEGIAIKKTLQGRTPYQQIKPLVKTTHAYIAKHPQVQNLEVAGSFRRQEETIGDIDFLVTVKNDPQELIDYFCAYPENQKILAQGSTKGSIILKEGKQVDLRVVAPDQWGAALQYFTGSKEHNVKTRAIAKSKGLKINEYGVFRITDNTKVAGETEEGVYNAIGLNYIPPEKRKNTGEVEAAQKS
jgi:DNA polymerase (family X)